jgi:hypothetical protein
MEETTGQGGRRAQKAKRKASQEERNQCRTRKEIGPTNVSRGGTIKERGSRQKSKRG